jgi:hypothetical protein
VSCYCANRLCINQPFFAIANALEPPHIWHISQPQRHPDIQQPVRARVQAVAGIVVVGAVVAYTASCDVGSRGLCLPLIGQPASDWSITSNCFTAAFHDHFLLR